MMSYGAGSSSNVRDVRGSVSFQLTVSFPEQEFDGAKVLLVEHYVAFKFVASISLEVGTCLSWLGPCSAKTLSVESQYVFLQARQSGHFQV